MVGGLALILDIHHIARVAISSVVGDNLGAAVGEENTVRAIGGVAITGLIGIKLNIALVAILGINSVLVLVFRGSVLVGRLMVRGSGLVGRGWLVGVRGSNHSGKGKEGNEGLKSF